MRSLVDDWRRVYIPKTTRKHVQEIWREGVHDNGTFSPAYIQRFTDAEKFVESKIDMLREDFAIQLTDEDIKYLRGFKTEAQINAAVRTIIDRHWG